jgi:hypothetical protein
MRLVILTLCAAMVSACSQVQTAVDQTARKGTKGVVTEVLATRFPQVPKELFEPFTDCVIDNSSASEIQEYIKATVRGVDEGTVETVRMVIGRPETRSCLQERALSSGLI